MSNTINRRTVWSCLTIMMLVWSLIGPAMPSASAQDDGTDTSSDQTEQPADTGDEMQSPESDEQEVQPTQGEMQPLQVQPASVTVNYMVCPPEADLVNGDGATLNGLCTLPGPTVTFTLVDAVLGHLSGVTAAPGGAVFSDLSEGTATLSMEPAPAAFAVFCQGNTPYGNTKPYARAFAASASVSLDVIGEEKIECDWFVAAPVAAATGSLTLYTWVCPPNVDPNIDTSECGTQMPGVPFTLTDGNGTMPFTSDVDGHQIDGIVADASGVFTIAEHIPMGYLAPAVYCQNNAEDPQPNAPAPVTVTNGAITIQPTTPTFEYQCFWYNVPDPSPSDITIRKWSCPAGYDMTTPGANPPVDCTTPMNGVTFVLSDTDPVTVDIQTDTGDSVAGAVVFGGTTPGPVTITEVVPAHIMSVFLWQCEGLPNETSTQGPLNTGLVWEVLIGGGLTITCDWYNIPQMPGTVTIYKWECPQGQPIDATLAAHQTACTQPMNDVVFTLNDGAESKDMTTSGGMVQWTDVRIGTFTVTEQVPAGYSIQPFVACDFDSQNNLAIVYNMVNNVLTSTLNHDGQHIICHWFNQYKGAGEVTVYKWTCPDGYDWTAWGANPKNDCPAATNGVTFVLNQPVGVDLQTNTGDSIDGAVYFGGLDPGDYVLNEIVPTGIRDVFVLDCVGLNTGSVHPVPLSVGSTLPMKISGGDKIRCDWFNVPAPQQGWLTVTKYACSTPTYVSDIDCEVFEGGKGFSLQVWNGTAWTPVATGTTNTAGQVTWTNLMPGTYQAVEQGGNACKVIATPADGNGNPVVNAKAGTIVKVYNCGMTPPPGGKMPTKYPNTGVDPSASTRVTPGASVLGTLGLAGAATMTRRSFLRRSLLTGAAVGSGGLVVRQGFANQAIQPIGTAIIEPDSTPNVGCLYPATPDAATAVAGTPVACARGAVPMHIGIEAIGVDADIEVLEIIAGEMQAPTGATDVVWYKETARLGEQGNILLAGHLNYWGVPEGVFFALGQLREGDTVAIRGDNDETYLYIVQWTRDFPSDEEPPEEALGQTDEQTVTMITCGGEWITDWSEYDHRTLVRAIRDAEYVPSSTPSA